MNIDISELDENTFALVCECEDEDTIMRFNEMGYDGNGYTWHGILESISRLVFEGGAEDLSFSPEADSAMVTSPNKDRLETLASEARKAFTDSAYMERVIANADEEELE
jgi:hypothetical protein